MEYITVKEAAEKWGVTPRRVQILCSQNRIVGAIRFGNRIMIPRNAKYPVASVAAVPSQDQQVAFVHLPRNTPFLHMTDLYSIPGSADVSAQKLSDNEELAWDEKIVYTAAGPTRSMAPRPIETMEELPLPKVNDQLRFYIELCEHLDGKCELPVKPESVLRVLKVMDAIFESDKNGQSVKCNI